MSEPSPSSTPPRPRARLHADAALDAPSVVLDGGAAHYLKNVLRLPAGTIVALFNARDGEYAAEIVSFSKSRVELAPRGRLRAPMKAASDVWLVFAPIKRAHLEFQIEKATELGAAALWPVTTRRTNVERVNVERLAAIAKEATEQSERLDLPEILAPATLDRALANWPAGRQLIVCDETGGGAPLAAFLAKEDLTKPWAILTGPEGGFAPEEFTVLRKQPFVRFVGLGPRVLRADTAALAALAVFQSLGPDAARKPRFQQSS
ncbi:MAG: 16S rRNA (uracil(1498)-N(3))-methyltransferase [Alphaproteobacteria bacterium]|nr:16S rRNA (uracil(1498)-N(3))-methyltransferase [Alphaproteobacteria bacterium]